MENILIAGTHETPEVDFKTDGKLCISGVSIPENISEFYKPCFEWLKDLEKNLPETVNLVFDVEYINTSTTRIFVDIIRAVMGFENKGINYIIVWRYVREDEDNLELGEYLQFATKAKMVFEPFDQ